jgi:ribosomal protein S18 acetylase RimI-like enzyme
VLSNYQGKGLGRIMIGEVIELAKERKKEFIWLGVWEENKKAIEFYKSMGFEKFGEHPYYIGQDKQNDWLMKLELPTL